MCTSVFYAVNRTVVMPPHFIVYITMRKTIWLKALIWRNLTYKSLFIGIPAVFFAKKVNLIHLKFYDGTFTKTISRGYCNYI